MLVLHRRFFSNMIHISLHGNVLVIWFHLISVMLVLHARLINNMFQSELLPRYVHFVCTYHHWYALKAIAMFNVVFVLDTYFVDNMLYGTLFFSLILCAGLFSDLLQDWLFTMLCFVCTSFGNAHKWSFYLMIFVLYSYANFSLDAHCNADIC